MAITLAASGTNTTAGATSLTTAANVGTGSDRFLVCAVTNGEVNTGDLVTGVTYNGVSMIRAGVAYQNVGNTRPAYLYYLKNPTSGSNNIVISCSASTPIQLIWSSFDGVNDIEGTPFASRLTSTTQTLTVTTSVNDCILVSSGILARGQTAGTNTTIIQALTGNTYSFRNTNPVAAGANSLVTTQSDSTQSAWVAIAMSPAGGGATPKRLMMMGVGQ